MEIINLPRDIINEILSYLKFPHLLSLSQTSKWGWNVIKGKYLPGGGVDNISYNYLLIQAVGRVMVEPHHIDHLYDATFIHTADISLKYLVDIDRLRNKRIRCRYLSIQSRTRQKITTNYIEESEILPLINSRLIGKYYQKSIIPSHLDDYDVTSITLKLIIGFIKRCSDINDLKFCRPDGCYMIRVTTTSVIAYQNLDRYEDQVRELLNSTKRQLQYIKITLFDYTSLL